MLLHSGTIVVGFSLVATNAFLHRPRFIHEGASALALHVGYVSNGMCL